MDEFLSFKALCIFITLASLHSLTTPKLFPSTLILTENPCSRRRNVCFIVQPTSALCHERSSPAGEYEALSNISQ